MDITQTREESPSLTRTYRLSKRALDLVLSLLGVILLSPLFFVVAALIKLDSRGPVFFRQIRIGRNQQPFYCYKFRSMTADAEERKREMSHLNEVDGPVFKIRNDPRITRTGRALRKCSLDELPQLWNVVRGEMSLVGPRPPLPSEVEQYEDWMMRRLTVMPGITGLWQVSGRSNTNFVEWMRLDMNYVDKCSMWLDIKILMRTIPAVIGGRGAY